MAGLNVGDVDFEAFQDVALIRVGPEIAKDRVGHPAFITPEARFALEQYIDSRRRGAKRSALAAHCLHTVGGG